MNKLLLLITTAPNQLLAEQISKELIEKKLAACISIKEIKSIYNWQGNIEENKEIEITIKSLPENLNELSFIEIHAASFLSISSLDICSANNLLGVVVINSNNLFIKV